MPGPQLTQAVDVCRQVRARLPHVPIVWGGYFPTQHADTVLGSPFVDYVIRSQGEHALLALIEALAESDGSELRTNSKFHIPNCTVPGVSWKDASGRVVHNQAGPMIALDDLPDLPYGRVDMERYIQPTYLGKRTVAHNSSFGCPFACSFCAVVAMTNRRWLAQSPGRMERVLRHLVETYRVDAVQMHDMDFFISEARVAEFAERIAPLGIKWWALGRVDTLMHYSDATWQAMARSGLKMLFSGAESASDATLAAMNKGGQASARLTLELARRMKSYGVVPEFSFVLGAPPDPIGDMEKTFEFIRTIKRVNPATEVILYTYTPVPMDGRCTPRRHASGSHFPRRSRSGPPTSGGKLMLRRGDGIPWLDGVDPPPGPRLRARAERVLSDGDRSAADGASARGAQGGERMAVRAQGLHGTARVARAAAVDALPAPRNDRLLTCTWLIRFAGSRVRQGRSEPPSHYRRARATRSGPTRIRRGRTTR